MKLKNLSVNHGEIVTNKMIINVEQFCKLASQGKVQVKDKFKRLSGVYNMFGWGLMEYQGEESKVWCTIEDYASYSKVKDGYKVIIKPTVDGYKPRDYYTSDLVSLINDGYIEMKIKL